MFAVHSALTMDIRTYIQKFDSSMYRMYCARCARRLKCREAAHIKCNRTVYDNDYIQGVVPFQTQSQTVP